MTKSEHEKEESRETEGARRATGVAREAAERNGEAPDPEVADKTTRRRFTAAYKRRIVREADKCTKPGEVGALLRREGVYSSSLSAWRRQRDSGELAGTGAKRGPKAQPKDRRDKRIANQLRLSRSSVAAVSQRAGLSQWKKLEPPEPVIRYEHDGPGEMLHRDIKKLGRFWRAGHRVTGNRCQDSEGAGWEYVHVCVDDYSRLAYAEVLPDHGQESAVAFLDRAAQWFAQFGVKVRRLLTDNGSCYRSRMFLKRCRDLDIRKKFTRPYRPRPTVKPIDSSKRCCGSGRTSEATRHRTNAPFCHPDT